ncbi:MAG: PIN domain-containing protein [Pseudonocardia sp.]|nr:PIN domain-containing protein [Pseudonocardia sp.]
MKGWLLDKSASARHGDPLVGPQIDELQGKLCVCPAIQLERLYSARSARDYDDVAEMLRNDFVVVTSPDDVLDRALDLQRDLAHHHGMWHRIPIPDLLIAVTALHHGLGVVHVDGDFDKIAEVRPLVSRRLG